MNISSEDQSSQGFNIVDEAQWQAIIDRDRAADGKFFYAVKTTGIYCCPSCASRRARRENVLSFATAQSAEQSGYRACKRCKPSQLGLADRRAACVTAACRIIEATDEPISLNDLAVQVGMSAYHFHRVFKSTTGLTSCKYAAGDRAQRVREKLEQGNSVTDAIVHAGYNSSSRFYERSNQYLDMTPSYYRAGGKNITIHFAVGQCHLGSISIGMSERGVCAILLGDNSDELVQQLQDRFEHAELIGADPDFESTIAKVVGFVDAPATGLDLPLDVGGTAFQQRVWEALRDIPVGETASQRRRGRSREHARKTFSPSPFPVTGSYATMDLFPAIDGGLRASKNCWSWSRPIDP